MSCCTTTLWVYFVIGVAVLAVFLIHWNSKKSEGFSVFDQPHDASAYPLDTWENAPSTNWSNTPVWTSDRVSGWSDPYMSTDPRDATSGEYTDPRVCSSCLD